MKGSETRLIVYMAGPQKRFIIPVYQRNYDWKIDNCKQLYDDLIKVIKEKRKSHFFGSIVSVYEPSGRNSEYLIIDGQQRLTTVSLLFLAIYNLITNNKVNFTRTTLKDEIYEQYLVDKYQPEETRIKLKLVKNDRTAFNKLFEDVYEYIDESNLTINYKYFYERILKNEITVDELYDAICRLEIINIELNNDDNPQLIFESLNSTGLELNEGDKIRNFVLMNLSSKEQEKYYDNYWNPIEKLTNYDVGSFVRDYLTIKQQYTPPQNKVYLYFKEYVNKINNIEDLLKDLLVYAKRYERLLNNKLELKNINKLDGCIYRLNKLETTVTRPFLLEALRLFDENKIDEKELTEIFIVTENYIFRRNICDLSTSSLNKIFQKLHRDIVNYDGTESNYLEKFKFALLSKKDRSRFPNDEEFGNCFVSRNVYDMNSKNKVYLLERLENYGSIESKDVYNHCANGSYTIEHIMPQNLTPEWIKSLGENYEQIYLKWIHKIANLTLTAYNSKYSNKSFKEKKSMEKGFNDSGIRLNNYLSQQDNWTEVELENRSKYLLEQALKIWFLPNTDFRPKDKLDSCTLEDYDCYYDEESIDGRKIAKFSYKDLEQPVNSWKEMFIKVLQILYSEDKSIIYSFVYKENGVYSYFSNDFGKFKRGEEINSGIFVNTNTNTITKISILKELFNRYGLETSELVFYFKEGKK